MNEEISKSMLKEVKTSENITNMPTEGLLFSRQSRWTMEADNLSAISCNRVKFDYTKQKIFLELYDIYGNGMSAFQWLLKNPLEDLTFKCYDASGGVFYVATFKYLNLLNHTCVFDMTCSEPARERAVVEYRTMEINFDVTG